ncbi:MAG TPA: AMP-binding protein [Nevskia sp.]|nr:AMP-binding protein [Nevskia sp.]
MPPTSIRTSLELLHPALQADPEGLALCLADSRYSFADLDRRARQLARRLHDLGLRAGDRVGIVAANHVAHLDLLLAAPKLGIVAVPLNTRLGATELAEQVAIVTPKLMLADDEALARVLPLAIATVRISDHDAWLAGVKVDASAPALPPVEGLDDDSIHVILFTGGSTGRPKGACLPYRQTLGNADDTAAAWGITAGDCAIQCTPSFHASAHVLSLPLLRVGGTVVLMPRFEPAAYLALAERHRASLMFMVPTMFQMLVAEPTFAATDLSAVRFAISGGAPCPPPLRDAFAARGIPFRQGFGMTEAGVNCFVIDDAEAARHPDAVGRPMPRMQALIRRADGSEAGSDEVGELCLAGPQICTGYLTANGERDSSLHDGWLRTGDLASRDASGLFRIRGRLKDLYISGGENVYPAEVEAALLQCPGVAEACVFGWPDARWGETGVALLVAKVGSTIDVAAVREALRERLAGYKRPAVLRVVDSLPRSAAGKVLRHEARALHAAATQAVAA